MKRFQLWMLVVPLMVLSACDDTLEPTANQYGVKNGSKLSGVLITNGLNAVKQSFVSTQLSLLEATEHDPAKVSLELLDSVTKNSIPLGADWDGATLTVRLAQEVPQELNWNKKDNCFENDQAQLCATQGDTLDGVNSDSAGVELRYHFKDETTEISLVLSPSDSIAGANLEAPKVYSLAEIVNTAKNKDFNSQIAFTVAQQSRENSLAAHLNLLPHVGISDIQSAIMVGVSTSSLIKSIGNLAPFLFPSRWFKAAQLKDQALADQDAYRIMQADAMNAVEGLSLNLIRDERVYSIYQQYEITLASLVSILVDRERIGSATRGSAASMQTILNNLTQTRVNLGTAIANEKTSIARAAGFMNPAAIVDITPSALGAVGIPDIVNSSELQEIVIHHSMELQQIEDLMKGAKQGTKSVVWSLLDPSGGAFLGFGLGAQIRSSKDLEKQVLEQRRNEQSALLAALRTDITLMQGSVAQHALATENLRLQRVRLQFLSDNINVGNNVAITDLQDVFNQILTAEATLMSAQFQFYITTGTLNRLLYLGSYAGLGRE